LKGLAVPDGFERLPPTWHMDETLGWSDKDGVEFFELLDIWHVPNCIGVSSRRQDESRGQLRG